MTAKIKISAITCLVVLLAMPLWFGEVFAQEPEVLVATETTEPTPSISTTTAMDGEEEIVQEEPWYLSERISGNIQVGDFVVGPGRTEIELNPGDTIIQEITVTNRISDNRTFKLEVEDISGSADGSSVVNLLGEERGPYSIVDYIHFPEDTFVLSLGERARIPVTITVPPDAEPGGYYGSVLVSTIETGNTKVKNVARSPVIARIGSLFFLTVRGDVVTAGKTLEMSLLNGSWWYESGPIELGIVYENTGSMNVNPYGELTITNMFGEEVGFLELDPWFVLPTSMRVKEVTWDREFLLGRYTAKAKINRGYDDIVDEVTVSFWVLPWKIVGGLFFTLFIIIFSLRAFFRTFEFKRKG